MRKTLHVVRKLGVRASMIVLLVAAAGPWQQRAEILR